MTEERIKYRVFKANIMDDDGNKVGDGAIVSLTPKTARHYNKLGYLRPYMDDDDDEEDDDDDDTVGDKTPEPVRVRRTSPLTRSTGVSTGSTSK